jgi:hypothetical protein
MSLWSSNILSFFVSKWANNWRKGFDPLQLLPLFEAKNETAFQDQSQMRKWITVINYSVVMPLWSSDTLSVFVSNRTNMWRKPGGSLQLLALFETKKHRASEDHNHMRKWITIFSYTVVMWLWSSDTLSGFVSKRPNTWREPPGSLQLLALFETNNERVSQDQRHMTIE